MIFDIFKDTIIAQNKILLKEIATKFNLDYDELVKKYITPANYLPVIINTNTQTQVPTTSKLNKN